MMSLPLDYEVRLQRPDGRLSLRMFMQAANDAEAKERASWMLKGGLNYASLWREGKLIDSLYAREPWGWVFGNLPWYTSNGNSDGPCGLNLRRPAIPKGRVFNTLACRMSFTIKYHRGETQIGVAELADSLDEAHRLIDAKAADLDHKADLVIIFRISPSGTEELEESRNLHAFRAPLP